MPFISMDDPQFWARCPKELEPVVRGGLTGLAYFELGEKKDNPPTVVALRMGPGWVLPRHAHDCYRFEIVTHGTLDVGDRILKPGDHDQRAGHCVWSAYCRTGRLYDV